MPTLPLGGDVCSKLRAPYRGTYFGPFACWPNDALICTAGNIFQMASPFSQSSVQLYLFYNLCDLCVGQKFSQWLSPFCKHLSELLSKRRHDQEVSWRLKIWRCLNFSSHRPTLARLLVVARKTCGVGPSLVGPFSFYQKNSKIILQALFLA